ncbi:MAG: hypothetical protein AMXMBFR56_03650 [Polyangiaceae bacterium]
MAPTTTETETGGDRSGDAVGGGWQLGRLLGSGGMASVYAATDPAGRQAAIKLLHPEMARRRELKERFLREAYVANRIGHPSVVKILDHADGPDVFLVVELLEGEPLSARLGRASELSVRDLLGFADQILDALGAAHQAGVIHRDIKPDNVFVTTEGKVKILDFGIARVIDDVPSEFKTRTGLALGTIPYMAPEQALGRRGKVDGRTDLFALGALLFRALAGRRIHEEPSEAELLVAMATKPAPRLADVAPNVPGAVCAIVDRALAFSQEARYPDAATMRRDVQAVLGGQVPPFALAANSRAEEATRIEVVSASSAASGRDAATVATSAPYSVRERTLESAGLAIAYENTAPPSLTAPASFAATPAAFASDAVPASLPPQSLGQAPARTPPPEKQRGVVALLAFAATGVLVLAAAGVALAVLRPWESVPDAAAGVGAESPSITLSEPGTAPSGSASGESAARAVESEPTSPATADAPAATAATPRAAPASKGAQAAPTAPPAPTAPHAPTTKTTGAPAGKAASPPPPAPGSTATAPKAPPAPTPTTTAAPPPAKPSEDKGKGKGNDERGKSGDKKKPK